MTFRNIGLLFLMVLLTVGPSWPEQVIYIRNQRLKLRELDGAQGIPIAVLRHVLTRSESNRLVVEGDQVVVTLTSGGSETFEMVNGGVTQWEALLNALGYKRRAEGSATGIVDFYSASARTETVKDGDGLDQQELDAIKKERSERRPGYRKARENYAKVIMAIRKGGTEEQRARVKRIGQRIADQSPLSGLYWTFEVIETPVPNALCTGEGFVIVTTGLLDLDLSDDELAGVLGHEVAHGVRRHALLYEERYEEAKRIAAELNSLSRQMDAAEARQDQHALSSLKSKGRSLMPRLNFLLDFLENKQSYDQHEEEEADVLGMTYAAKAGYDPEGEGRALTKLKNRSVEMFGQAYQKESRTHPPLERRLEILDVVQRRWRAERGR